LPSLSRFLLGKQLLFSETLFYPVNSLFPENSFLSDEQDVTIKMPQGVTRHWKGNRK
jgi:hypothetical protein